MKIMKEIANPYVQIKNEDLELNLHSKEYGLLNKLYKIQSPSKKELGVMTFIESKLKKIKNIEYKFDKIGNLLITKGELNEGEYYPCIVAHTDTVHDFKSNIKINVEQVHSKCTKIYSTYIENGLEYYFGGCGDDKNGVWLALILLEKLEKIKIILTVQEENGCIGASNIDETFLTDIGYYIEGDRKGSSDIINNYFHSQMTSETFDKIILTTGKKYGYSISDGAFTDICELYKMNSVSAINVSIGYYNAHRNDEYTIYEELINAKNYVFDLVKVLGNIKYPVKIKDNSIKQNFHTSFNDYDFLKDHYSFYENTIDSISEIENKNYNKNEIEYGTCETHVDESFQDLIDMDCKKCNPIISTTTFKYCGCTSELHERKFSYFCPICQTHKLNKYD